MTLTFPTGEKLIIAIYLILGIFYIFPSGSPQPADLIMALFIIFTIQKISFEKSDSILLTFLIYTFLINSLWGFWLNDLKLLIPSVFYTYNIIVYAIFKNLFRKSEKFSIVIIFASAIALTIQALFLLFLYEGGVRATGTFTNPNQLSYFAICFTSLALVLSDNTQKIKINSIILALGWVCVLLGLSKAGIAALLYMTFAFVLLKTKNIIRNITGLSFASALGYIYFWDEIGAAQERMLSIGNDNDDSLAGRGYDRIVNNIELVFFGAGEGQYLRHDSMWGGEIHSSFGTILFCYGIIGFSLFIIFLYSTFKRNPTGFILYCAPLFLYSLTHHGLRYTPFWIVIAAISAANESMRLKNKC